MEVTRVRICPNCGTEYRPEVERCADCGDPLAEPAPQPDARFSPPARAGHPATSMPQPSGPTVTAYFTYEIADLRQAAERLSARGLPFRVAVTAEGPARHPRSRYDILVSEPDREAAAGELLRAGTSLARDGSPGSEFDPERGYLRCPACQAHVTPGAPECLGCGLVLCGDPTGLVCSACGAIAGPTDDLCGSCGAPFEA